MLFRSCAGFVSFQYGELSPWCAPHRKVISILEKHNLINDRILLGYPNPVEWVQEKEEVIAIENGEEKDEIIALKKNDLLNAEHWHETVCMALSLEMPALKKWLDKFIGEMIAKEDFKGRTTKDLKHHFVSWLKIEIKKENKNGIPKSDAAPDRYRVGEKNYRIKNSF